MNWAVLFERAAAYETDAESIREALAVRRESRNRDDADDAEESDGE